MRNRRVHRSASRAGQAIAEFVVGLVGILILTAALLQLGALVRADSRNLITARAEAGMAALGNGYIAPVSPGPRYIRDWSTGPDGHAYTRDDQALLGNAALLSDGVVSHTRPDELERLRPGNTMSALADSSLVLPGFSFVRGYSSSGAIPLYPLVRNLIYGRDSITLESEVYLIWTRVD